VLGRAADTRPAAVTGWHVEAGAVVVSVHGAADGVREWRGATAPAPWRSSTAPRCRDRCETSSAASSSGASTRLPRSMVTNPGAGATVRAVGLVSGGYGDRASGGGPTFNRSANHSPPTA
jgi:hypothetical protein